MVQTKCDDKHASGRVCSYSATCCVVVPLRPDESHLIQQRNCEWVEQALQLQIVDISKHRFDYIPMLSIWWKVTMLPTFQNDSRIVPCEVFISYSPYSPYGSYLCGCSCKFKVSQKVSTKVRPFCGLYWRCEPTLGRGVAVCWFECGFATDSHVSLTEVPL